MRKKGILSLALASVTVLGCSALGGGSGGGLLSGVPGSGAGREHLRVERGVFRASSTRNYPQVERLSDDKSTPI